MAIPEKADSDVESSASSSVDLERASQFTLVQDPAVIEPAVATTTEPSAPTSAITPTSNVAPPAKLKTPAAAPREPSTCDVIGDLLCMLITLAAIGGIIYGIYYGFHKRAMNIQEAQQAQQAADMQAQEAANQAAQRAALAAATAKAIELAKIKGPEVFWEMLKEFREFKVAMVEEMKALRGVSPAAAVAAARAYRD